VFQDALDPMSGMHATRVRNRSWFCSYMMLGLVGSEYAEHFPDPVRQVVSFDLAYRVALTGEL
jgi:hypothetical protein